MSSGPLSFFKVLDLSHGVRGAYCAKLLADWGADAVKIEPPGGDETRRWGPFPEDRPDLEASGMFQYLNTNKKGLTLDFTTATGREILNRLLAEVQVVVEDYPPKEASALGITFDRLSAVNPLIVVSSITPFGQNGPYRDYAASDLTIVEMSGMGKGTPPRVKDPENRSPLRPGPRQSEFLAGVNGAVATLHGLLAREQQGRAIHVDVSQREAIASLSLFNLGALAYENLVPKRTDGAQTMGPLIACSDGLVCVLPLYDHQWQSWLQILGLTEEQRKEILGPAVSAAELQRAIAPIIREWAKDKTREEVAAAVQAGRVPVEPVRSVGEAAEAKHLAERGYFATVERDGHTFKFPGASFRLSRTPWELRQLAPRLGEHNEEILCQRLGYAKRDLAKMKNAGVI